ncbi:hypothetical protein RDI58_018631 [Solanum bulbocastanum]|uniref:F-box domain-containing protein n=1 Tax=Solanum bulbocastanum TaxID=147425 RepID=A0AAN8TGW1_SOLBU
MSDYIPKELMNKIFTRLPIKSILRCTSVCKSCNGVVTIVGSCNGIMCLAAADQLNYLNHFYFWNPSIRKPVELPEQIYTCEKCDTFAYALGFGFDHVTNDYKVVRVVDTWSHPLPPHVDLYKLSTGVWEYISHVSLSYLFLATTSQAYVNGASHWIASKWDVLSFVNVIVLFNMHDETFSEMILPKESLCLVDNSYDKRDHIDIWMMKEYGAPDSWVKQFSIQNNQFAQHIPLRDDFFWTPYSGSAAPTELEIANEFLKPMAIRKMVKSYGKVTEDYWFQLIIQVKGFSLTMKTSFDVLEGQSFHEPEVYGTFNTLFNTLGTHCSTVLQLPFFK